MGKTLEDKLKEMPPERREKIKERAEELIAAEEAGFQALSPDDRFAALLKALADRGLVPYAHMNIRPEVQAIEQIDIMRRELDRKNAQIVEAIAILENGTDYEKAHVVAILREGLNK